MSTLLTFILSEDPVLRLSQFALIGLGIAAVYLVCYTTRDIILRTHSFLYQAACILLTTVLPVGGFFLYLLVRPARTNKERELDAMIQRLMPNR